MPDALRVGIAPVTDEERDGLGAAAVRAPTSSATRAPSRTTPKAADEFYLRTTAEPSVEVNGILGGKPGLKNTTVVSDAQANFTVRLAPGQTPEDGRRPRSSACSRRRRPKAPRSRSRSSRARLVPGSSRPDSQAIKIAQDAFESAFGIRPILTRSGGTLPIMPALQDKGIPTILTGFALPESNVHSPNERMLVEFFPRGVDTIRELYTRLGDLS